MTTLLLFGSMLLLALIGVPLVFAILAASVVTLLVVRPEMPLLLVGQVFMNGMDQFLLLAVGFFFLAANLRRVPLRKSLILNRLASESCAMHSFGWTRQASSC